LVYADDVYLLGKNINTRKEITETLSLASGEVCLGMKSDKTKCMLICCEQNAEQLQLGLTSKFFENVGKFRCL